MDIISLLLMISCCSSIIISLIMSGFEPYPDNHKYKINMKFCIQGSLIGSLFSLVSILIYFLITERIAIILLMCIVGIEMFIKKVGCK